MLVNGPDFSVLNFQKSTQDFTSSVNSPNWQKLNPNFSGVIFILFIKKRKNKYY
jgi:hypothetical protein